MWKMVFISCYAIYKPCGVLNVIIKRYDRMSKSCCCWRRKTKRMKTSDARLPRTLALVVDTATTPRPGRRVWRLGFRTLHTYSGVPHRLGVGGWVCVHVVRVVGHDIRGHQAISYRFRISVFYTCFWMALSAKFSHRCRVTNKIL